jgi:hypothetical protein
MHTFIDLKFSGLVPAAKAVLLSTAFLLVACQTPPPPPPQAPVPVVVAPQPPTPPVVTRAASIESAEPTAPFQTAVEKTFAEGLELYEKGDYPAAIKKLQSPELKQAWPELRVRSLKYLAFSYCVSNDLTACHAAFYEAIQVDPEFNLKPAEQGHPIWGAVFKKAKLGPPGKKAPAPRVVKPRPTKPSVAQ